MAKRLFIDEITSIGMVGKGDNPESEVLIYKAHKATLADRLKAMDTKLTLAETDRRQSKLANIQPSKETPMTDPEGPQDLDELVKENSTPTRSTPNSRVR